MAVQKLSAIAAAGGAPAVTDQAVFVTGGATDNLVTVTQLAAGLPAFTSTLKGSVPASGGGTTNFLRADGTFAAPTGTAPGGSTLQIQYNAGAFGGANIWRTTASQTDFSNGVTPVVVRVYNTTDNNGGTPTTGEWGAIDWATQANILVIGFNKTATGANRAVQFAGSFNGSVQSFMQTGGFNWIWSDGTGGQNRMQWSYGASGSFQLDVGMVFGFNSAVGVQGSLDTGISRAAAKVIQCNDGAGLNTNGWIQTAGDLRLGSDVGFTSNVVLATIMSVALQAGRSYAFDVYLSVTGSAGGLQAAMVASGGLTATAIQYDGYVVDNAAAGTKGAAQASALGTVVANPATIVGPASANIRGLITVNVAGTIQIQASQATSSATTTTVKRGSWAFFRDTP